MEKLQIEQHFHISSHSNFFLQRCNISIFRQPTRKPRNDSVTVAKQRYVHEQQNNGIKKRGGNNNQVGHNLTAQKARLESFPESLDGRFSGSSFSDFVGTRTSAHLFAYSFSSSAFTQHTHPALLFSKQKFS